MPKKKSLTLPKEKVVPPVIKPSTFTLVKKDYRWKIYAQSAFITLSSIFLFGGAGWMLDKWIRGEGHLFFILMLIISYPVTQITLYQKMKNIKPSKYIKSE